jgi:hypothetical protein
VTLAVLRFGDIEFTQDVGEPAPDGLVFVRVNDGGNFIPIRDTGEHDPDGRPVFRYALERERTEGSDD